jgi:hypothetical protein
MPEDTLYKVTEAVLLKRDEGSMWRLTFSPQGSVGDEDIKVLISPDRLDNMYFATLYGLEEIDALARVGPDD